ncbi:MAG: HD domain-containing protein, partial [Anaerolineales bacterium]|nr:HD domain-containing protein [Anaerolineales bacterium]
MESEITILDILKKLANRDEIELVENAYSLLLDSIKADETKSTTQKNQAIEIAYILAELETGAESVAAGLLVDLPDSVCSPALIGERVSPTIAELVKGVIKIR